MWTGEVTRESFEERDADELTRFYLFMADRVELHDKRIEPWLSEGRTVISDRGPDSTRGYQYHTSGLSEQFIETNLAKIREPHLTVWFDLDVDAAMGRLNNQDDFERPELQQKVNERYRVLWKRSDRIKRVDGSNPTETVVDDTIEAIRQAGVSCNVR
jgi:thymidylate kinase